MIPRYTLPEMGAVWTDEHKFETWRQVEIACMRAWADLGVMPHEAADEVEAKASIDIERIDEIEATVHHDMIAFVTSLAEQVGPAGRHIHYGLTSSDVLDTALGLQLRDAGRILLEKCDELLSTLARQARKYRKTPIMGRTHGVHAEPTTFGLKLAMWYEEVQRARERLARGIDEVCFGKISGATGTYAQVPPDLEERVCEQLGLTPAPISSQIVGRDRHASLLSAIALLGGLLEKFAVEIRHLQRTEVREVEEPFGKGQKGSSAMPHKRNPIIAERISGMARLLRGNALAAMENVALWHERDISHSSVERVILPDATITLDYMLDRMIFVLSEMVVYPKQMRCNIEQTGGLIFSQKVLLALVNAGMKRDDAYRVVQDCAMKSLEGQPSFCERVAAHSEVKKYLDHETLANCFDVAAHLVHVDTIFKRLELLDT